MAKLILFNLAILLVVTLVKSQAGRPIDVPVNSPEVQRLVYLFNALNDFEKIIRVISAKKQIIEGNKYFLNVITTEDFNCVITFSEKPNGEVFIEKQKCQEKKKP